MGKEQSVTLGGNFGEQDCTVHTIPERGALLRPVGDWLPYELEAPSTTRQGETVAL